MSDSGEEPLLGGERTNWERAQDRFWAGIAVIRNRLNDGYRLLGNGCRSLRNARDWSRKKQGIAVGSSLVALFIFILLFFICHFGRSTEPSPTTTTTASPDTDLSHCGPSSLPQVTYSASNPWGIPQFWDEGVCLIPCKDAGPYNEAIVQQMKDELARGLWERKGDTFNIRTEGGVFSFMKASVRFSLIAAKVDHSLLAEDDVIEYFGNEFNKTKCLQLNEAAPQYFACNEATLTELIDENAKTMFKTQPHEFTKYIQSKVLLFSLLLGEYQKAIISVIVNKHLTSFRELLSHVESGNHTGMAEFMNEEDELTFDRMHDRMVDVTSLARNFLVSMDTCALQFQPASHQTWNDCIYYNYPDKELVDKDILNGNKTVDL